MTKELQHAMAEYEEARARYRKAVLASLDGASSGEAIRVAIREFQAARAELARHGEGAPADAAPPPSPAVEEPRKESFVGWGFVRRLLHAS